MTKLCFMPSKTCRHRAHAVPPSCPKMPPSCYPVAFCVFTPDMHVSYIAELSARRAFQKYATYHDLTEIAKHSLWRRRHPRGAETSPHRSSPKYHHSIARITASTAIPHVVERFCLPASEQSAADLSLEHRVESLRMQESHTCSESPVAHLPSPACYDLAVFTHHTLAFRSTRGYVVHGQVTHERDCEDVIRCLTALSPAGTPHATTLQPVFGPACRLQGNFVWS